MSPRFFLLLNLAVGTIGLFDEVTLALDAGANELWMAVSESFGGWGLVAWIEPQDGVVAGLAP